VTTVTINKNETEGLEKLRPLPRFTSKIADNDPCYITVGRRARVKEAHSV